MHGGRMHAEDATVKRVWGAAAAECTTTYICFSKTDRTPLPAVRGRSRDSDLWSSVGLGGGFMRGHPAVPPRCELLAFLEARCSAGYLKNLRALNSSSRSLNGRGLGHSQTGVF